MQYSTSLSLLMSIILLVEGSLFLNVLKKYINPMKDQWELFYVRATFADMIKANSHAANLVFITFIIIVLNFMPF